MAHRRSVLQAGLGLALSAPALSRGVLAAPAGGSRVLRFVPEGNLQNPDPIWATTTIARNFGFMVWDTLYGLDETLTPRPQMCAGHEVSADGLVWRFRLREGLRFHDGVPVRAADCIASIQRWSRRDGFGQVLARQLDALRATDDASFEIRLTRPFPKMLLALGKAASNVCFVMPERLARTDAFTQIAEYVGSGPYRFLRDEWSPGALAAFARFEGYVPRDEPPSFIAGGKRAWFDRIEWVVIPDSATASAALIAGEVDWWQLPVPDLYPLLRASPLVRLETLDRIGQTSILRFNMLQPPFDNLRLRRALLPAVSQADFMAAARGDDASLYRTDAGVFPPGSPLATDAGIAVLTGPRDLALARRQVAASGYHGETAVLLSPTDYPTLEALCQVARDLFTKLGITVDYAASDWGTVVQRRASKLPVAQGGWSAFCTNWEGLNLNDPGGHFPILGNGEKAWVGWPTSPRLEALRAAWFDAEDLAEQRRIAAEIQLTVWDEVPYLPLGHWFQPVAVRTDIADLVASPFPIFWGVQRR